MPEAIAFICIAPARECPPGFHDMEQKRIAEVRIEGVEGRARGGGLFGRDQLGFGIGAVGGRDVFDGGVNIGLGDRRVLRATLPVRRACSEPTRGAVIFGALQH